MLRFERERLGEVGLEIGGPLAGDPVDEIERDVVETGITENVHGPPDVLGLRATLQYGKQRRLEALCAHRHAIDTVS